MTLEKLIEEVKELREEVRENAKLTVGGVRRGKTHPVYTQGYLQALRDVLDLADEEEDDWDEDDL